MIAHVSSHEHSYNETLQVVQLAAKLFRLRVRRKTKVSVSLVSTDLSSSDVHSNARVYKDCMHRMVADADAY